MKKLSILTKISHLLKSKRILFGIKILFLLSNNLSAQYIGKAIVDSGRINGAAYRIDIPANWNKNLVMHTHGFSSPGSPAFLNSSYDSSDVAVFVKKGFALARSEYRDKGWVYSEGIEDNEALRKYFEKKYDKPDSTFIAGHSLGGGIALATIEKYPQYYQGALAMCPASSTQYLLTKVAFDIVAVFNVMYPGTLPSLSKIMTGTADVIIPVVIEQKIKTDTTLAERLAKKYEYSLKDLPFVLTFSQVLLRDIATKSGGNPFDNTNTLYAGYGFDWELNQKIERLTTTPGVKKFLELNNPTGVVSKPVVIMHTIYDQQISPSMAVVNYDNMVHMAGKETNLVVFYTNGQRHCNFTAEQTSIAFEALRKWVATGSRPKAGAIQ